MQKELNILIADAGGTSTDWALVVPGAEPRIFRTAGINPAVQPDSDIEASVREAVAAVAGTPAHIDEIYFYGAGCRPGELSGRVAAILGLHFSGARIEVAPDILGAARALFGRERGVCCILGTGSASCLYDGREITDSIPSLGYILGDEGSGAAIGRRLINDYFKRRMPQPLADAFRREYNLTVEDVIERVYRTGRPANRWLASFAPFCSAHIDDIHIQYLLRSVFGQFISRNVAQYALDAKCPVGFVGSIADTFREQLRNAVESAQFCPGPILKSPLERLIAFHTL